MTDERIHGSVQGGLGKAESRLGGVFGDSKMQGRGAANQVEGAVRDIYGRALNHANQVVGNVDQVVNDRTYATLAAVALVALTIGLIMGAGRSR